MPLRWDFRVTQTFLNLSIQSWGRPTKNQAPSSPGPEPLAAVNDASPVVPEGLQLDACSTISCSPLGEADSLGT